MWNVNSTEPVISVKIGGISRDLLIDSGSASNLSRKGALQELKYQGLKIELKPCTKRLYAYGGRELGVEDQFHSEVSLLLIVGIVYWDIQLPQILETFVWILWELSRQETVTLLIMPFWENSKKNIPVCSRELESLKITSSCSKDDMSTFFCKGQSNCQD